MWPSADLHVVLNSSYSGGGESQALHKLLQVVRRNAAGNRDRLAIAFQIEVPEFLIPGMAQCLPDRDVKRLDFGVRRDSRS